MTVRQFRINNPFESREKFQETIDNLGLSYDWIFFDDDNSISIITQESIANLRNFKNMYNLTLLNNVSRKVLTISGVDTVQQKIRPSDLS